MTKNKSINLLPQKEFEVSTLGRVLKWATGTFRIIVIVTEMIVMGAFLSRFWLDAQNRDLNNSIKVKSAQIAEQSSTEKDFRNVQSKLDIFSQISQLPKFSQRVESITSRLPPDITLSGISVTDTSTQIKAVSNSEAGIVQFISNLQADKDFTKVELGQVSSSDIDPSQTMFSINVSY